MNFSNPESVIHISINKIEYFPGNLKFPLLIYKQVFFSHTPQEIQNLLTLNGWSNAWLDSIYDFHHYHSKTHEVLVIMSGHCKVQFGGESGVIYTVSLGDVVIIPAGVAHKSLSMSQDFSCMGAYPEDVGEDINYGDKKEYLRANQFIKQIGLPHSDPVFGNNGLIFSYWK